MNFSYNQKVVPISKSVGIVLDKSVVWNAAQLSGQNYLYFKGSRNGYVIVSNVEDGSIVGDHFKLEDLIPYEENIMENELASIEIEEYKLLFAADIIKAVEKGLVKRSDRFYIKRA